jgi:hypothetical protein
MRALADDVTVVDGVNFAVVVFVAAETRRAQSCVTAVRPRDAGGNRIVGELVCYRSPTDEFLPLCVATRASPSADARARARARLLPSARRRRSTSAAVDRCTAVGTKSVTVFALVDRRTNRRLASLQLASRNRRSAAARSQRSRVPDAYLPRHRSNAEAADFEPV